MRRGAWHQFGDKSQLLVLEQLQRGAGVGAIISPRDLSFDQAVKYTGQYRELGADVVFDPQFYVPSFDNANLASYQTGPFRLSVTQSNDLDDSAVASLSESLRTTNHNLSTTAVVAPALVYEASQPNIAQLNAKLFSAAKHAGEALGLPTYATVVLGSSVTSSQEVIDLVLSSATALESDGWYYGFEFAAERLPSARDSVLRFLNATLSLACTNKPILNCYAGPMALLSVAAGCRGAAIGHSQNLWKFTRGRWQPTVPGGNGKAPPRFFSTALWGTIIYPDEISQLSPTLRSQVVTTSPFSGPVGTGTLLPWSRWEANKHHVNIISQFIANMTQNGATARNCAHAAQAALAAAILLHGQIASSGITLRDETSSYQANWQNALTDLLSLRSDDYDYLEMLS